MLIGRDSIPQNNDELHIRAVGGHTSSSLVPTPPHIAPNKPRVPLNPLFSTHPSKNFVLHLLAHHTRALKPTSVLDAGCGDLRNLQYFPRDYVGITREAALYFAGLERPVNQDWIRAHGTPTVYLTALENDFSSVGAFDLCVCTHTLSYLADKRYDVITRLIERVNEGGSLIMNGDLETLRACLDTASRQFGSVEVIYCGSERTNVFESDPQKSFALSIEEMDTPNTQEGHSDFYLLATQKKSAAVPPTPARKIHLRDNLLAILGSGLVVYSQKMTVAAMQMADMKVGAHRS